VVIRSLLEDENGLPHTAGDRAGWVVLIAVLTLGWGAEVLALFLALWVRLHRGTGIAIFGFLYFLAAVFFAHFATNRLPVFRDWIDTTAAIVWVASCYLLRYEIRDHYKKSWNVDLEISLFFTFCFGPLYINYCLNPPILFQGKGLTSLKLSGK
jgi:hypothetical protein